MINPVKDRKKKTRIIRDGTRNSKAWYTHVSYRRSNFKNIRGSSIGFRIVRSR